MQDINKVYGSLSIQEIKAAPQSDYMNEQQCTFFRNYLIELHDITREHIRDAKAQLANRPELADISDRASWEEECAILMRIVDREQRLLPKIQDSLERIRLGEYGYCQESGEPIGIERLLARPTAEYCADVKQTKELTEHAYAKIREES
ncbi:MULTISPECIES: TraR/DksA family transcriptional regulator [Pseudoalteromonas]|uniref:TraR/DksA family transcriptional regulator n=1 Tax=Pseudoalteromonas TaxID=53246 RepID=UPI001EF41DA2|nr:MULTISPECIES: TraR/DksA C4-type zinc finger protein [unclassified Pseudoalteromonas]MCG7554473.1 TraR/DksA C4-type zinc finger protein [Pseudoalteromonas sp. Of11M-6]MCG9761388.1 TraR/DksA C4-type zinc finger protein [Pseudoalteromonas sp. Isolate6]